MGIPVGETAVDERTFVRRVVTIPYGLFILMNHLKATGDEEKSKVELRIALYYYSVFNVN